MMQLRQILLHILSIYNLNLQLLAFYLKVEDTFLMKDELMDINWYTHSFRIRRSSLHTRMQCSIYESGKFCMRDGLPQLEMFDNDYSLQYFRISCCIEYYILRSSNYRVIIVILCNQDTKTNLHVVIIKVLRNYLSASLDVSTMAATYLVMENFHDYFNRHAFRIRRSSFQPPRCLDLIGTPSI